MCSTLTKNLYKSCMQFLFPSHSLVCMVLLASENLPVMISIKISSAESKWKLLEAERRRARLTSSAKGRSINVAHVGQRLNTEDDQFRVYDRLLQVLERPFESVVAAVALVYRHHHLLLHLPSLSASQEIEIHWAGVIRVAVNDRASGQIPLFGNLLNTPATFSSSLATYCS